jgi:hypothetical protein
MPLGPRYPVPGLDNSLRGEGMGSRGATAVGAERRPWMLTAGGTGERGLPQPNLTNPIPEAQIYLADESTVRGQTTMNECALA